MGLQLGPNLWAGAYLAIWITAYIFFSSSICQTAAVRSCSVAAETQRVSQTPISIMMNIQDVTPILNVSSLEESFVWFEKLGWKKHWEHGDPPNFGAVISGTSEIFLCQGGQGARGGPMPQEPWDNQAGSTWMAWWLDSPAEVDQVYALALKLGIHAPWPPTDMTWNVHECHIRHPDGHTIRVSARLEELDQQ